MTGEGDQGPRYLHTGVAAPTHGVVDAHEMEGLDSDDGGFLEDGLEGQGGSGELVKVFALGIGGLGLDECTHGKYHKEQREIVWTAVLFARNRRLPVVEDRQHLVPELALGHPPEKPVDLLKIGVSKGLGAGPGREM